MTRIQQSRKKSDQFPSLQAGRTPVTINIRSPLTVENIGLMLSKRSLNKTQIQLRASKGYSRPWSMSRSSIKEEILTLNSEDYIDKVP